MMTIKEQTELENVIAKLKAMTTLQKEAFHKKETVEVELSALTITDVTEYHISLISENKKICMATYRQDHPQKEKIARLNKGDTIQLKGKLYTSARFLDSGTLCFELIVIS